MNILSLSGMAVQDTKNISYLLCLNQNVNRWIVPSRVGRSASWRLKPKIVFMLCMIYFVEESEAFRKFGQQYLDYRKQLPWFCFKIECLKELFKSAPKNYYKH